MRLERLGVTAFGRFRGLTVELRPGLNVVQGPNEAGKSTLFQFIVAMLYGFNKPGLKRRWADERKWAFRPWLGDAYEGWLEYEHEGRRYRVERRFDRDDVRVLDALTGKDLTGTFELDRTIHEPGFARRHTGLEPVVFRETVSIPQLQLATGADLAREVQGKLRELGAGGGDEVSVQTALDVLQRALDEVGTERAPTRPLVQKLREVERLSAELAEARRRLEAIRADEAALAEARREREAVAARLAAAEAEVQRLERALVAGRLAAARAARRAVDDARRAVEEHSSYAAFPARRRDALVAAVERQAAEAEARRRAEEAIARLQEQSAPLRERVASRPELSAFDALALGAVRSQYAQVLDAVRAAEAAHRQRAEAEAALAEAERALAEALPAEWEPMVRGGERPLAAVERLEREIAWLEASSRREERAALERRRDDAQRRVHTAGLLLLLGGMLAAASAVAAALSSVSWSLGVLVGLALAALAWRWRAAGAGALADAAARLDSGAAGEEALLGTYREELDRMRRVAGAADLAGLRERARAVETLAARVESLRQRVSIAREQAADAAQRLAGARAAVAGQLEAAGVLAAGEEPTAEAVQAFSEQLTAHLDARQRLRELERDLATWREAAERAAREEAAAAAEVAAVCAEAGVPDAAAFHEGYRRHQAYRDAAAALEKAEAELRAHLRGASLDELEARAQALGEAGLEGDDAGAVAAGEVALHAAEAERERLVRALAEVDTRIARLESGIEAALKDVRPLPELAESLAAARRELLELRLQHAALSLARETIAQVAADLHREFAPRLNETVAATVARLTRSRGYPGGRYRQVRVGEDLAVSLEAPETGQLVPLDRLSGGTIDQVYFALRLAIAEIVSGRPDLPLFCDDSFIQYDDGRLEAALGLLAELAAERQVVLFTCHRREMATLDRLGVAYHAVELPGP